MRIGDRVIHKEYGKGVITKLDCRIRKVTRWIVKFDKPTPFPWNPAIYQDELTKEPKQ